VKNVAYCLRSEIKRSFVADHLNVATSFSASASAEHILRLFSKTASEIAHFAQRALPQKPQ
jgi:hypothetical protein